MQGQDLAAKAYTGYMEGILYSVSGKPGHPFYPVNFPYVPVQGCSDMLMNLSTFRQARQAQLRLIVAQRHNNLKQSDCIQSEFHAD